MEQQEVSIQDFFKTGMKREIPELLPNYGDQLELGPGNSPIGVPYLDWPDWDADASMLLCDTDSVDVIHMYHFLEHVINPIYILRECERALRVGGHINIVVPHKSSALAYEDLDHKTFFTEETIPKLLGDHGCLKNKGWKLEVHTSFIMAVAERNLSIFTQLRKVR